MNKRLVDLDILVEDGDWGRMVRMALWKSGGSSVLPAWPFPLSKNHGY